MKETRYFYGCSQSSGAEKLRTDLDVATKLPVFFGTENEKRAILGIRNVTDAGFFLIHKTSFYSIILKNAFLCYTAEK